MILTIYLVFNEPVETLFVSVDKVFKTASTYKRQEANISFLDVGSHLFGPDRGPRLLLAFG